MTSKVNFVLKIVVLSAVLAAAIKYLGPYLAIPATSAIALTLVLLPTLLMAVALAWRAWQSQSQQQASQQDVN